MRTWQALSVSSAMHACMQPADRSNPTALDTNTNPVCHVDPPVVPWPVALLLLVCSSFACIRGRRQPAPAVSRAPPRRATQRSHGENSRKPRQRLARVPARPLAPVRRQGARPGHHGARAAASACRARLTWPLRAPCATFRS
jgi:hypothetical protein